MMQNSRPYLSFSFIWLVTSLIISGWEKPDPVMKFVYHVIFPIGFLLLQSISIISEELLRHSRFESDFKKSPGVTVLLCVCAANGGIDAVTCSDAVGLKVVVTHIVVGGTS